MPHTGPERPERVMSGRQCVYTRWPDVDASNVARALEEALQASLPNHSQERYLWDYFRGRQEILHRVKDVRPEICNRVVENRAQQVVFFKLGYQLSEPVTYTLPASADGSDDGQLAKVSELNALMASAGKDSHDRDLFEHMLITGHGYRMVESREASDGGAPFAVHTLDPWSTFVAYSCEYHHRPVFACWEGVDPVDSMPLYNVYTASGMYYLVKSGQVLMEGPTTYGGVPIVEYRLNNARMGVFEPVLPLLDAVNAVVSNRLDGIEQTVQSLMKFVNCDVDEETFSAMLQLGAVKITSRDGNVADVDVIKNELDQTQTQVTKEDLLLAVSNICGMPHQHQTGASTSDTGAAVMLRDGWTMAESHAKGYELQFKASEREFLRIVLGICRMSSATPLDMRPGDVEVAFNRRNYEDIQSKVQAFSTLLATEKVAPAICFKVSGIFADPAAAWEESRAYVEEREAREAASASAQNGSTGAEAPSDTGQPAR